MQLYYQIALNGRRDLPYAPDEFSGFCMTLLRMLAFAPGAGNRAPLERPAPERVAQHLRLNPRRVRRAALPVSRCRRCARTDAARCRSLYGSASAGQPHSARSPRPLIASEPTPQGAWDWLAVVASLRLGGMAKMLADHCELVAQTDDAVTLRVGEAHKHLLDRTYQDKLVAALARQVRRRRLSVSSNSARPLKRRRSRCVHVSRMSARPKPWRRSNPIHLCVNWSSSLAARSTPQPFNP